ncbi:MAG: P-loop NTPase fold protein [Planctomycetota bacterium]
MSGSPQDTPLTFRLPNDEPVLQDYLGRDIEMLSVVDLVVNGEPPLVIGIQGDWGTGKSSLMRSVQSLLDRKKRKEYGETEARLYPEEVAEGLGVANRVDKLFRESKTPSASKIDTLPTVWFNPWQHQFEKEPIFPLLDAIRHQQSSRWSKLKGRLKNIVEDPKFRIMGKAALGVASMTGADWFSAIAQQVGDTAQEVADSFSDFSREFDQCMDELTRNRGGKLVIFIDDLDRCEADYIVKTLEALKLHLLNRHCVYVLGCATERVTHALESKLGHTPQQAREYLDKIIQFPQDLPTILPHQMKSLLHALGYGVYADSETCLNLLQAYADDNPRRLKRFLLWHAMESRRIDLVPGLREQTQAFLQDPAVLLKIHLMRFRNPYRYVSIEELNADRPRDIERGKEAGDGR